MSILTDPVPANWPQDAKTLVADLRRAYRALENDCGASADPSDDDVLPDDDITRECVAYRLTQMEGRVFRKLRERQNRFVPRDAIYSAMYGLRTEAIIAKSVDIHICKVRAKLRAASAPYRIENKFGVGYRVLSDAEIRSEAVKVAEKPHPLLEIRIGAFVAQDDIRRLCWAADTTMKDIAKVMGLKANTVHSWAAGFGQMPAARGVQIANLFKAKQSEVLKAMGQKPKLAA